MSEKTKQLASVAADESSVKLVESPKAFSVENSTSLGRILLESVKFKDFITKECHTVDDLDVLHGQSVAELVEYMNTGFGDDATDNYDYPDGVDDGADTNEFETPFAKDPAEMSQARDAVLGRISREVDSQLPREGQLVQTEKSSPAPDSEPVAPSPDVVQVKTPSSPKKQGE